MNSDQGCDRQIGHIQGDTNTGCVYTHTAVSGPCSLTRSLGAPGTTSVGKGRYAWKLLDCLRELKRQKPYPSQRHSDEHRTVTRTRRLGASIQALHYHTALM